MKPDFALSLSFDGIAFLKRASAAGGPEDGWYRLGEVSLTEPDLGAALKTLRARSGGDPALPGPEVKLLLPEEQVRFMTIAAGEDDTASARLVEQALDGATPYAVSDLVYDWAQLGDQLHVAAVARETLAEAESFATDHDFVPMCFVTVPPKGDAFPREPFFGPTRMALTSLTPGVNVRADDLPVAVLGDAPEPPEPAPAENAPKSDAASAIPPAPAPDAQPGPEDSDRTGPQGAAQAADDGGETVSDASPAPDEPAAQADDAPEPGTVPRDSESPADAPDTRTKPGAKPGAKDDAARDPDPAQDAGAETPAAAKPSGQSPGADQGAPPAQPSDQPSADQPKTEPAAPPARAGKTAKPGKAQANKGQKGQKNAKAKSGPKPVAVPSAKDTAGTAKPLAGAKAPDTAAATTPAFASIRAKRDDGEGGVAPTLSSDAARTGPGPAEAATASRQDQESLAAKAKASLTGRPRHDPAESTDEGRRATAGPGQRAASMAASAIARASTGLGKGIGFVSRRSAPRPDTGDNQPTLPGGDQPTPPPAPGGGRRFKLRAKGAATAMTAESMMDERDRMTVFGARSQNKVGGKPRFLGVILTSILLLCLLAVGAWASLFLDGGLASLFRKSETPAVASAPPDLRESETETPPAHDARPVTQLPETALTLPVPDDAAEGDDINVAALSEGVPVLRDDLVDDQLNGLSVPREAESLPPEQAEARYAATGIWQRAPAPPDEPQQGVLADLYVASIDPGVDQGDAVALVALREHLSDQPPAPRRNPLPFDSGLTFDENGMIEPTPEGVVVPGGYRLILGAPEVKPPQRPAETLGDLAPDPATPQAADDAPVVVDETLTGLRPRPRPGDLVEQNERANLGDISLKELGQKRPRLRPEVSPEKTEGEADETATENAVATSLKPNRRPSGFASLVERARKAQDREVVRTAAVAPRTVQPRIPSSANVAQQATVRNAINLRKVNLIGVYGKPSARRALVRLSNGRYKKVKVGDRIDGGRVAAIGEDRLSYTKSGRQIVLRMPRG